MKLSSRIHLFFCGLVLTLAAFPVFAQKGEQKSEQPKAGSQEFKINRQSLQDWSGYVREKLERGELDLSQSFKVVADVSLEKDGRIDWSVDKETNRPKSAFVAAEGEEQMMMVAKSAVEAVGNSGFFFYLKNLGVDKFKLTLAQDKERVFGGLEIEQTTLERANTLSSMFNTFLSAAKVTLQNEDEKTLVSGFRSVSSEKIVMLKFELPARTAREMIERNLQKRAEAEKW